MASFVFTTLVHRALDLGRNNLTGGLPQNFTWPAGLQYVHWPQCESLTCNEIRLGSVCRELDLPANSLSGDTPHFDGLTALT
jgi:hypothetical protein